ncbi:MAG: hypothetical protein ABI859_08540 [Pseudomonadota bacterium]
MGNIRERAGLTAGMLLAALSGCGAGKPPPVAVAPAAETAKAVHCLPQASGFLRARLRGAINTDLSWSDADMTCEGGARPDGKGIRISIAGPLEKQRRLRLLFGIDNSGAALAGAAPALPTNITAILEGEKQLFATLGDDKCTTEQLQVVPLGTGSEQHVAARGFCIGPASTLDGRERLLVTTFDFSTRIVLGVTP